MGKIIGDYAVQLSLFLQLFIYNASTGLDHMNGSDCSHFKDHCGMKLTPQQLRTLTNQLIKPVQTQEHSFDGLNSAMYLSMDHRMVNMNPLQFKQQFNLQVLKQKNFDFSYDQSSNSLQQTIEKTISHQRLREEIKSRQSYNKSTTHRQENLSVDINPKPQKAINPQSAITNSGSIVNLPQEATQNKQRTSNNNFNRVSLSNLNSTKNQSFHFQSSKPSPKRQGSLKDLLKPVLQHEGRLSKRSALSSDPEQVSNDFGYEGSLSIRHLKIDKTQYQGVVESRLTNQEKQMITKFVINQKNQRALHNQKNLRLEVQKTKLKLHKSKERIEQSEFKTKLDSQRAQQVSLLENIGQKLAMQLNKQRNHFPKSPNLFIGVPQAHSQSLHRTSSDSISVLQGKKRLNVVLQQPKNEFQAKNLVPHSLDRLKEELKIGSPYFDILDNLQPRPKQLKNQKPPENSVHVQIMNSVRIKGTEQGIKNLNQKVSLDFRGQLHENLGKLRKITVVTNK